MFKELKEVHLIVRVRGEECRSKFEPNHKVYQPCLSCGQREPVGVFKQRSNNPLCAIKREIWLWRMDGREGYQVGGCYKPSETR